MESILNLSEAAAGFMSENGRAGRRLQARLDVTDDLGPLVLEQEVGGDEGPWRPEYDEE